MNGNHSHPSSPDDKELSERSTEGNASSQPPGEAAQSASDRLKEDNDQLMVMFLALESTGNGLIITNPKLSDNPIIHANQVFVDRCGFRLDQIIGKNCRFLQQNDRQQNSIREVKNAILEQRPIETVFRNYRKDGSLYFTELSIAPVHDSRGKLTSFVGVQYDAGATDRAKQRIDECYSVLSHELRTPITSVSVALNLLNEGGGGKIAPLAKKLLKRAEGNCVKLAHLVDEILDLKQSNYSHLKLKDSICSISDVIAAAARELSQLALHSVVDLRIHVPKDADLTVAKGRLKKAIVSLATVAIRNSPVDGKVIIRAERISQSEARILVSSEKIESTLNRSRNSEKSEDALSSSNGTLSKSGSELELAICRAMLEFHDSTLNTSQSGSNETCYWFVLKEQKA
jgi:PAS domain S-box-containing protein